MKNTLRVNIIAAILSIICLGGCATVQKFGTQALWLWNQPTTQEKVAVMADAAYKAAFAAGLSAVDDFAKGEKVNLPKAAMAGGAAALYTAASYVRTLQGTSQVINPTDTATKLEEAGIAKSDAEKLADIITSKASELQRQGMPADKASEINASAFDAAAAFIQSKPEIK
jgi:hypothetical protein